MKQNLKTIIHPLIEILHRISVESAIQVPFIRAKISSIIHDKTEIKYSKTIKQDLKMIIHPITDGVHRISHGNTIHTIIGVHWKQKSTTLFTARGLVGKRGTEPFKLIIRRKYCFPPLELQSSSAKNRWWWWLTFGAVFVGVLPGGRLTKNWQRAPSSTFDIKERITMNKSSAPSS